MKFTVAREIGVPLEDVWRVLDDFNNTYVHHPSVEHSSSVNGKPTGLGAQRECTMYGGQKVQERIIAYNARDTSYKITVVEFGPTPMTLMNVGVSAKATGPSKTKVTYEAEYLMKFGPVGYVMGRTMVKPRLTKMMTGLIDGLEAHIRTGRIVGRNGDLGPDDDASRPSG